MNSKRRRAFIVYCLGLLVVSLLVLIENIWNSKEQSKEHDSEQISVGRRIIPNGNVDVQQENQSAESGLRNRKGDNFDDRDTSHLIPDLRQVNIRNETEKNLPLYLIDIFPNASYPPFQPTVDSDFPTTDGIPRIPHIIHQTFRSVMLPYQYAMYAKKIYEMNPTWKYYFWTDESARNLIKDRHPYLLEDWDNFNKSISKGDFLRYVVLYEFGGAYIDLDVDSLRPLDRVTMKYACIIPTEPFEHSVFIYETQIFMNNAIMFCRPKHPFFKQMLENIKETLEFDDVTEGTGPGFVTRTFIEYNAIDIFDEERIKTDFTSNSPYFYRGDLPEVHDDAVYVPNTHYFTDSIDIRDRKSAFRKICRFFEDQEFLTQRACREMRRRGMIRKNKRFRFLSHRWHHFWMSSKNYKSNLTYNITRIAPKRIIYGETRRILVH